MGTLEENLADRTQASGPEDRAPGRKPWPRYVHASLGRREYWSPALYSRDLRKKPVEIKMLGEDLVFVRREGKVYALHARCQHRGMPLSQARYEFPGTITCAFHGWTYELASGKLV